LISRQVKVEIRFLDDSADTGEDSTAVLLKILSENFNRTGGGHEEGQDHPNGRTFSRSIRTEKGVDIAAANMNIQIPDGPALSKALAQIPRSEDNLLLRHGFHRLI
jgi:hypothetical protein